MEEGERLVRQEDCSEDSLGTGILTLTSRRIAFDRTASRMIDFSKRFGETILDIPLSDITRAWKEGLFMKKACIAANVEGAERVYRFGVLGTGGWVEAIEDARAGE